MPRGNRHCHHHSWPTEGFSGICGPHQGLWPGLCQGSVVWGHSEAPSGLHLTTHSRSLSPKVPGVFPTYHTKGLLAQLSCAKSKLPATKDQTGPLWLSVRVSKILVFLGWGPEEKQPPLSQRLPWCGLHGRGCLREEGHLRWRARLYGVSSGVSKALPLHCLGPHTSSGCSDLGLRGRRPRCVLESCQPQAEAGARFPDTAVLPQETRSLIAAQ